MNISKFKNPEKQLEDKAGIALNEYIRLGTIQDFDAFEFHHKLVIAQKSMTDKIKTRQIGKQQVRYLPWRYCMRVMNFLFSFRISTKIQEIRIYDYIEEKDEWKKDPQTGKSTRTGKKEKVQVHEAVATVVFTFTNDNGNIYERTVVSKHKQYPNPATCKGDADVSAISKAWTQVAETFGIGDDLLESEESAMDRKFKQFIDKLDAEGLVVDGEVVDAISPEDPVQHTTVADIDSI